MHDDDQSGDAGMEAVGVHDVGVHPFQTSKAGDGPSGGMLAGSGSGSGSGLNSLSNSQVQSSQYHSPNPDSAQVATPKASLDGKKQ